ncbi:MAG: hypothetical protein U1F35_04195 [Steroidobacteraceae bacterium]
MSTSHADIAHREIWLQIPWYVNDRIDAAQRERTEAHLRECIACRAEVAQQRRVHALMSADPGIELLPSASLARLRQRIEQTIPRAESRAARSGESRHRMMMAAAVAGVAVILGVLLVTQRPSVAPPAGCFTVSTPRVRPPAGSHPRGLPAADLMAQMQHVLEQNELRIVAGPTEAGVYSLAPTGTQPVPAALATPRRCPCVSPKLNHAFAHRTAFARRGPMNPRASRLAWLLCLAAGASPALAGKPRIEHAALALSPEHYIVAGFDNLQPVPAARAGSSPRGYDGITRYGPSPQARRLLKEIEEKYHLREVSAWPIEPLHMHCAVLHRIPDGADRGALLAALSADPRIRLAQPLQTFETRAREDTATLLRAAARLQPDAPARRALAVARGRRARGRGGHGGRPAAPGSQGPHHARHQRGGHR